ncbi:MAG: TIGR03936 family radical SAM-associated protein [Clostridia bacterium]|nr:TIGR03936 family radical SAM-associated protein [Clostridia bacterium]
MRLAVRFTKGAPVRFVSHLDVQRLFQRAFRRAKLPLAYSQGFNPHPLVSFATALSVGMTSMGEYLDVTLTEYMSPESFIDAVSTVLPKGIEIVEAFDMGESRKSLTSAMRSASYMAEVKFEKSVDADAVKSALDELLSGEIVVMKKTKGGIKPTDIRPMVISVDVCEVEGQRAEIKLKGVLSAEGGLNPDMFLKELYNKLGVQASADITRLEIEMDRTAL